MMIVNLDYATVLAVASVFLSMLFEYWPALKAKWDVVHSRVKPLLMAIIVTLTSGVIYLVGCYLTIPVIFNPPLVCLQSGFADFLIMIGFGFGSQQLFYAFLKAFAASFTPPSGFDGVDPSGFEETPKPVNFLGATLREREAMKADPQNTKLLVTDEDLYTVVSKTRKLKKKGLVTQ